jgi:hypothetical protein
MSTLFATADSVTTAQLVGAERCAAAHADPWIDIDPYEFPRNRSAQLHRLCRRYRGSPKVDARPST